MILAGTGIISSRFIEPPFDPDAQAYIDAVVAGGGSLSVSEQEAINTYFVDLKTEGLYNKFYYLHLFLGGVQDSNKINSVNPGTYDLGFQGTWTHGPSGSTATQNNANYATSGFVISAASPSTTQTDFSFGVMVGETNQPITAFQYQGIGTDTSNYMILGWDLIQSATGWITNFWSTNPGEYIPANTIKFGRGIWNSMSRNGASSWYTLMKAANTSVASGMEVDGPHSSSFTPSATPYDLNLFRVNGLNQYTIGGRALMNYASTYISPAEMDIFMEKTNTLQVAFSRNIFTT